jgi:hypothetical protein
MKSRMKVILLLLLGVLIVFIIPTDGIQAYYNKSLSYAPNNHQWLIMQVKGELLTKLLNT